MYKTFGITSGSSEIRYFGALSLLGREGFLERYKTSFSEYPHSIIFQFVRLASTIFSPLPITLQFCWCLSQYNSLLVFIGGVYCCWTMKFNPFPLLAGLLSGVIAGIIIRDGLPFLHKRIEKQPSHNNARKADANSAQSKRMRDSTSLHCAQLPSLPNRKGRVTSNPISHDTGSPRTLEKLEIINQVKFDAEKIGRSFTDAREIQWIRENEQHRLKLDHQITSLLLRLDAIEVFILPALVLLWAWSLIRGMQIL